MWQWWNYAVASVPTGGRILRFNLDETSVKLFQGEGKGIIFSRKGKGHRARAKQEEKMEQKPHKLGARQPNFRQTEARSTRPGKQARSLGRLMLCPVEHPQDADYAQRLLVPQKWNDFPASKSSRFLKEKTRHIVYGARVKCVSPRKFSRIYARAADDEKENAIQQLAHTPRTMREDILGTPIRAAYPLRLVRESSHIGRVSTKIGSRESRIHRVSSENGSRAFPHRPRIRRNWFEGTLYPARILRDWFAIVPASAAYRQKLFRESLVSTAYL